MMNQITLLGDLQRLPTYHCTQEGQDLTRFTLRTRDDNTEVLHFCTAWGPAALDLHQHLRAGDRLLVRGELRYRERPAGTAGHYRVPVVHVSGYTYLGRGEADTVTYRSRSKKRGIPG